jgi:hypothetical protein
VVAKQLMFFTQQLPDHAAAVNCTGFLPQQQHIRHELLQLHNSDQLPERPAAAAAAEQQIRINPGNFADGRKTFEEINYDDPAQFEAERAHIEEVFTPLVSVNFTEWTTVFMVVLIWSSCTQVQGSGSCHAHQPSWL